MTLEDKEKLLRVYILNVLVSHSGKRLNSDLIGVLTSELLERFHDVLMQLDINN